MWLRDTYNISEVLMHCPASETYMFYILGGWSDSLGGDLRVYNGTPVRIPQWEIPG